MNYLTLGLILLGLVIVYVIILNIVSANKSRRKKYEDEND